MLKIGTCENTSSSLPFSLSKRQSGQSSWGVEQTCEEMPAVIDVLQPKIDQCKCKVALTSRNHFCTTYFSLKISFSCSVQTFMNCRALYIFIGSSIRPFMLINLTRLCSESYIMGGMTDSCLICFSLFCGTWTGEVAIVTPIRNSLPCSINHLSTWKYAPSLCDLCRLYPGHLLLLGTHSQK